MADDAFDKQLAVFLAESCRMTYEQYHNEGKVTPPKGYELVKRFTCRMIAIEEWFGFVLRSSSDIVVAFRGTQSDIDYIGDGSVVQIPCPFVEDGGRVHLGFLTTYDSCRKELLDVLADVPDNLRLYVTGHSLGAALATLHALDVAVHTGLSPTLYTYGSPRVGDLGFVDTFTGHVTSSVRVANSHDIVPDLPPAEILPELPGSAVTSPLTHVVEPVTDVVWRYGHVPESFILNVQKNSIVENHAIETYIHALQDL